VLTQRQNLRVNEIKQAWALLDEEQKVLLIPELLASTAEWRAWSLSDDTKLEWLEGLFKEVGLPFYTRLP
jgi:hypothetical protein